MSTDETKQSPAERVTLAMSVLILAGVLALAGWADVRTGDAPPTIRVEPNLAEMREEQSGFYVPIAITNDGGKTAESVTVSGELLIEGEEPETADVTIDFLAGGETEQAELVFTTDPNEGEFSVAPASFLYP